jgi:hypothetical protein
MAQPLARAARDMNGSIFSIQVSVDIYLFLLYLYQSINLWNI